MSRKTDPKASERTFDTVLAEAQDTPWLLVCHMDQAGRSIVLPVQSPEHAAACLSSPFFAPKEGTRKLFEIVRPEWHEKAPPVSVPPFTTKR
ncbi:hypothetical protein ACIRL2_41370 [Embleya sp. NPDC127516]|uniref:hypothetical protein n=1 Tax=Embleya sp. NPDC127516 TaxID=3363990 RepID=UPI003822B4E3